MSIIKSIDSNDQGEPNVFLEYLAALIIITLPLKNIFVSVASIVFVFTSIFFKKKEVNYNKAFLSPLLYFIIMALSLFWTKSFSDSESGLQKALTFLVVPIVFLMIPKFSKHSLNKIVRIYSLAMVIYALIYIVMASVSYMKTQNMNVFFFNNLVPEDPGAIYMSVFASFALFYFVQLLHRNKIEKIALTILTIFLFLLSSKSIITIDFIIIVCYYAFFAKIPSSTKTLTIISVSLFLFFSIFFVKEVRERFVIEYETAFFDNTLKNSLDKVTDKIHNITLKEAWNSAAFQQNDFFPGTALRVYQARIFKEMLAENNIFFTGFGVEASQDFIRKKAKQHHLFYDYGEFNFHNQYIQTFAELGIVGVIILLSMLFLNIKKALAKKDFLHIAFAITMIMLFLSESFFCRQRGIVFFVLLFCLFNSEKKEEANKTSI
jgi:hypothetical protein